MPTTTQFWHVAVLVAIVVMYGGHARADLCFAHDECSPGFYCDTQHDCWACADCFYYNDPIVHGTCDVRCEVTVSSPTASTSSTSSWLFTTTEPEPDPNCVPSCFCDGGELYCFSIHELDTLANISTHFHFLDLSSMGLTEVPPSVYKFTQLTYLDVSRNTISELPDALFGNLTNLEQLFVYDNLLSSLPGNMFTGNLRLLDAEQNLLLELPSTIGQAFNLNVLVLDNNLLESLPDEFTTLPNITYLSLAHNLISVLPERFGSLTSLRGHLRLQNNLLTVLPESMGNLTGVRDLSLWSNFLSELPDEFVNMKHLETADFDGNKLEHLPDNLPQLTKLSVLLLESNQLTQVNGSALAGMPHLKHLALGNNFLTSLEGDFLSLQALDLDANLFVAWPLVRGTKLASLDLSGNAITSVPTGSDDRVVLPQLRLLRVGFNALPTLNVSTFQATRLAWLDVQHNNLTTLAGLETAPGLLRLDVRNNALTQLPEHIEHLSRLQFVSFQNNAIEQADQLETLPLLSVDMSGNRLTRLPKLRLDLLLTLSASSNAISTLDLFDGTNVSVVPLSTLLLANNPSVCTLGVDPNGRKGLACDCAPGYVGITSCAPIDEVLPFVPPDIAIAGKTYTVRISPSSGIPGNQIACIKTIDHDGQCKMSFDPVSGQLNMTFPGLDSPKGRPHGVRLTWPGSPAAFEVQVVEEAFTTVGVDRGRLQGAVGAMFSYMVPLVVPNFEIPTNVTYQIVSDAPLPRGLALDPRSGMLEGRPAAPTRSINLDIVAYESFSLMSEVVTSVSLDVIECYDSTSGHTDGDDVPGSCHAGTCVLDNDPYDGVFECKCPKTATGKRCELVLAETDAVATLTQDGLQNGLIAFGVILGVLILGVIGYYWFRSYDRRKTYHIFISYRVASELRMAERSFWKLQQRFLSTSHRVRVFWDKARLAEGVDWEQGFTTGLRRSCMFLPLISKHTLDSVIRRQAEGQPDHFVKEIELAIHYARKNRLIILPVLVGSAGEGGKPFERLSLREYVGRLPQPVEQMLKVQGLFLETPKLTQSDYDFIVRTLDQRAWQDRKDSLELISHWHAPKDDVNFLFGENHREVARTPCKVVDDDCDGEAGQEQEQEQEEDLVLTLKTPFTKAVMKWMHVVAELYEEQNHRGLTNPQHDAMNKLLTQLEAVRGEVEPLLRDHAKFRVRSATEHRLQRAFRRRQRAKKPQLQPELGPCEPRPRRFRVRGLLAMLRPKKSSRLAPAAAYDASAGASAMSAQPMQVNQSLTLDLGDDDEEGQAVVETPPNIVPATGGREADTVTLHGPGGRGDASDVWLETSTEL
eukprot:m.43932 g.43932  ORF g.43932 m.43932 type:complete len:1318 (+) comp11667_c0_seq3:375-4328(+)